MDFPRPTLSQLIARITADFESKLTDGRVTLRRAVVRVFAAVYAGALYLLYGFVDFIARQAFPDTAEGIFFERWCRIWKVEKKEAAYATGAELTLTGTNGTSIPAETEFQRADGALYMTDEEVTIADGEAVVSITALEAGAVGNAPGGVTLLLTSPISGVDSQATVGEAGIVNGVDEETDKERLPRLLDRIQNPPMGGSKNDYERWAKEVSGVTRSWCRPMFFGAGTVGLTFVQDGQEDIIPDSSKVEEVQEYIDAPSRKPVTADLTVFAPVAVPLNFTIHDLAPNTAAVRAAIAAELEDLIMREAEPGGTILLSHVREAISRAAGENDHTLVSPSADVSVDPNQLTTMGSISWA